MRRLQQTTSVPCHRSKLEQYKQRSHGCFAGSSGIRKPLSQALSTISLAAKSGTFALVLVVAWRLGVRLREMTDLASYCKEQDFS